MSHVESAAILILRASLPVIRLEPCDFTRAAAFEQLSTLMPAAEAEQLLLTADAVRKSGEAQLLLSEMATTAGPPDFSKPTCP